MVVRPHAVPNRQVICFLCLHVATCNTVWIDDYELRKNIQIRFVFTLTIMWFILVRVRIFSFIQSGYPESIDINQQSGSTLSGFRLIVELPLRARVGKVPVDKVTCASTPMKHENHRIRSPFCSFLLHQMSKIKWSDWIPIIDIIEFFKAIILLKQLTL